MKTRLLLICILSLWCLSATFCQFRSRVASKDVPTAGTIFSNYLKEAERGDTRAMVIVGGFYKDGYGVATNPTLAFNWYKRAADQGNGRAWYQLGMLYKYGSLKSIDYKKAYECFVNAASLGNPDGIYSQGYMLFKGLGCQQNYEQALQLFIKAANAKVHEATYFVGLCYRNGYGVPQSENTAKYWLRKAVWQGDKQAQFELAAKEPENTNEAGILAERIKAAEAITPKTESSIRKFKPETHDATTAAKILLGKFTGYLLKYDWSGTHILEATKLTVDFQKEHSGMKGVWSEENTASVPIKFAVTPAGLVFSEADFAKTDHYNKSATKRNIKAASLHVVQSSESTYLSATLDVFAPERKEPEKPQRIVLVKATPSAQTTASLAAAKASSDGATAGLTVFPNPITETFTVLLTVNKKTAADIAIYDGAGRSVYTQSAELQKGTNKLAISLKAERGVYLLKAICGANDIRTVKIIKP